MLASVAQGFDLSMLPVAHPDMARQYILLFENYLVNNKNELGEQTKSNIDTEVNVLIDDCLRKAKWILNNKMESLYYYSEQLMKEKIITF